METFNQSTRITLFFLVTERMTADYFKSRFRGQANGRAAPSSGTR